MGVSGTMLRYASSICARVIALEISRNIKRRSIMSAFIRMGSKLQVLLMTTTYSFSGLPFCEFIAEDRYMHSCNACAFGYRCIVDHLGIHVCHARVLGYSAKPRMA